MAQTTDNLPCARNIRRSDKRKSRTAGGKRAVTAATHHLAPTDQATDVQKDGPASPGIPGQDGSSLEIGTLLDPARRRFFGFHRELFSLFWKQKSKAPTKKPMLSLETVTLIKEMAAHTRLWGAERIRGELLKLDFRGSQTNDPEVYEASSSKRARGQTWKTFLHHHAAETWASDFLQGTDLFFRPFFAFFIIELKSRKVMHMNVTRFPTDLWVAQQLREATPYGQAPQYLIRDNDKKFGLNFARVAITSGIKVLRTP